MSLKLEHSLAVNATPEAAWRVFAHVELWSTWDPGAMRSARWTSALNSLGKAITINGGNYNLEGDADLYFFYSGGTTAQSFTERIDQSLAAYSNLVITLSGGAGGEQTTVTLVLNDGTDHSVSLATYGTVTTAYKSISIPLSAFGANLASTAFLRVEGRGTATTIRINDISAVVSASVAPSITTQPASVTVTAPATATFSVVASGTATLTYQWKKNGTAISGATAASYTTPATTSADNAAVFTVTVTNTAGSVTSSNATLTVTTVVAPTITTQPTSKSVTAGSTATFSVVASGTATLTYQWKKGGTAISGATAAS